MSDYAPRTRVGRFKVRLGIGHVEFMTVWKDAYGFFVHRHGGRRQVRLLNPPLKHVGARRPELIEWEIV
mgnify:CR=1 FL=1